MLFKNIRKHLIIFKANIIIIGYDNKYRTLEFNMIDLTAEMA